MQNTDDRKPAIRSVRRAAAPEISVFDDDQNSRIDVQEIARAIWRFGLYPLLIISLLIIVFNASRALGVVNIGGIQIALNSVIAAITAFAILAYKSYQLQKAIAKTKAQQTVLRAYAKLSGRQISLAEAQTILATPAPTETTDQI